MTYKLIIKSPFYESLDEAYNWYEDASVGLGERLLGEIDICFEKLAINPMYYSIYKNEYRRFSLEKFPYQVIYEVFDNTIVIYALFHTSQNK